jgi:C-terminal processing protease CtpA/Prc
MRGRTLGLLLVLSGAGCQEDPFDFGQPRNCEIGTQNAWVYELMLNAYLWAEELPDIDPLAYDDPATMVADIRFQDVDRWSRVSDLETTEALFEEGMVIGLGTRTDYDTAGNVVFSFVHPLSPAGQAGVVRGDRLVGLGGFAIDQVSADDLWDQAYGPNEPGVVVDMVVESGSETRELSITKDWYPLVTVPYVEIFAVAGRSVGYFTFTTFVEPSVAELDDAFTQFRDAGVREVIVDLRYNGGGSISTARHLIDLLVGGIAEGRVSYRVDYTGVLDEQDTTRHVSRVGASLPAVDKVVFITTGSTLSASELVINGVRPHVAVDLVGDRTGGKPVGSHQWSFCDKVAQPITFALLNAENYGEYFDGLPADCVALDDVTLPLADASEASITAALSLLAGTGCPAPPPDPGGEAQAPVGPRLRLRPPAPPGAYPGLPELEGLR